MLEVKVDVVIFSQVSLRMKHQIVKGKVIMEKNSQIRVEEEVKAMISYLDMRPYYQQYENKMGEKF